ncbi:MAG: hypothetical protein L3K09_04645, partial [Thermoplasmata archaeon]|nr:hypothetical protein [Thermoplasmata archaeon]
AIDLGNDTCKYLQATEPSFAVGGGGLVVGAFVEENRSTATQPVFPPLYAARSADALGFVSSSDNGSTWSTTQTLNASGNIARPAIAAFGENIYVVFENITNSSTKYPGGPQSAPISPIALEFLRSLDGGTTWTAPRPLPGENASMGYSASAPSIAVNRTGALEVTYATNRTCVAFCSPILFGSFADDIVSIVSLDNGTSFSPLHVAENKLGEDSCWSWFQRSQSCFGAPFGWTPLISSGFSPDGSRLLVATAGSYAQPNATLSAYSYDQAGVFFSEGSSNGTGFRTVPVAVDYNALLGDDFSIPEVGMAPNGTIYVAYTDQNESSCPVHAPCSPLVGSVAQFVRTSSDGLTFGAPALLSFARHANSRTAPDAWTGWTGSIAFTVNGTPVIGYSLPLSQGSTYDRGYHNFTNSTMLTVAFPYSGPTVNVTFSETGVPGATPWTFFLNGQSYTQSSSSRVITDVPYNQSVVIGLLTFQTTYWQRVVASLGSPSVQAFLAPSTVQFHYNVSYGVLLTFQPLDPVSMLVNFYYNGTYFELYEWQDCVSCSLETTVTPAFPWFFTAGTVLPIAPQSSLPVAYWNGTGNGSFTGHAQDVNLTLNGPIQETAWSLAAGVYNETFVPVGLPASSTYTVGFNGSTYSAAGDRWLNVSGIGTGAYPLGTIQATSSRAGWEYFGRSSVGSTVVVPAQPSVTLTFSEINVSAPDAPVSFHALGLSNGTVWRLTFNGTSFSSKTPWINASEHPGNYSLSVGTVVAANGSVGYTPVGVPSGVALGAGTVVNVSFVDSNRIDVIATSGGSVSAPGVRFVPAGSVLNLSAYTGTGYNFGGWSGVGAGSFNGSTIGASITSNGPIVEVASFFPLPADRFNLTYVEQGLPTGTPWSVFVNGVGYSSSGPQLTIFDLPSCGAGAAGTLHVFVQFAVPNSTTLTQYDPGSYLSRLCLTATGETLTLSFSPEFTLGVSATPGGFGTITVGSQTSKSSVWGTPLDNYHIAAFPDPGYRFLQWNGSGSGSYTGTTNATTSAVLGPVEEVATFAAIAPVPLPTYSVYFALRVPLSPGTAWSVTFNGTGYSSSSRWLNLTGLPNGWYSLALPVALSPDGLTQYTAVTPPPELLVNGSDILLQVTFLPAYALVVSGTPGGSVNATPGGSWFSYGQYVDLTATADPGYAFVGWEGNGSGSYTGSRSQFSLTPSGPVREFATFAPLPPAPTRPVLLGAPSSQSTWEVLAAVGIIVGLLAGVAVGRWRSPPPPEPPVSTPPPEVARPADRAEPDPTSPPTAAEGPK